VRRVFGDRAVVLRPGLIVGPFDHTDRFTYWPVRFDEGGDVLAPPAQTRVRYIDARDLAAFVAHLVERSGSGTFNCVTPPGSVTFGAIAEACMSEASAEDAQAVWVSEEFLALHDVQPWSELPLWIPESSTFGRLNNVDSSRALAAGLAIRSLHETVRDTLAWARTAEKRLGALAAGLSPEREAELLTEARARQG
ncbi:MAG TPA: hypothetical protein VKT72_08345, partial [Candidatus Baltobacteraceae bacterium]|nr:hypothetical protein [Candidatus Baltobacteraceae bacterium]